MWAAPVGPVAMAGPRVRARRLRDRVLMPAGVLIKMPRDRNDASVPGGPRNPEAQAERHRYPATRGRSARHDARRAGPAAGRDWRFARRSRDTALRVDVKAQSG